MLGMMPRVMLMSMPAAPMVPRGAAKPFCISMTSSAVRLGSMSKVMGGILVVTNRCTIRGHHFFGKHAHRARRWQIGKQQKDPGERHTRRAILEQFFQDLVRRPDQSVGEPLARLLAGQVPGARQPVKLLVRFSATGADDYRCVVRQTNFPWI